MVNTQQKEVTVSSLSSVTPGRTQMYPRRPQAPPPPAKEALEWGQVAPEASEQKPGHSSLTLEEGW